MVSIWKVSRRQFEWRVLFYDVLRRTSLDLSPRAQHIFRRLPIATGHRTARDFPFREQKRVEKATDARRLCSH